MARAIVLLSGGMDSTAACWLLPAGVEPALALTADYGQKAARRELAAAYAIARRRGIPHGSVTLPFLKHAGGGALVDPAKAPPSPENWELDDAGAAARSAAAVWVPNRNGVLIAVAAALAEAEGFEHVICGFNREEGATFPDNSEAFLEAANRALALSTRNGVTVLAPTIHLDKREIAEAAWRAGAPLDLCWPCYLGEKAPCGRCESCRRFRRALDAAGVPTDIGGTSEKPRPGGNP